jgi:hypothetical protein
MATYRRYPSSFSSCSQASPAAYLADLASVLVKAFLDNTAAVGAPSTRRREQNNCLDHPGLVAARTREGRGAAISFQP